MQTNIEKERVYVKSTLVSLASFFKAQSAFLCSELGSIAMSLLSLLEHYYFLSTHLDLLILLAEIHVKKQAFMQAIAAQPWTQKIPLGLRKILGLL